MSIWRRLYTAFWIIFGRAIPLDFEGVARGVTALDKADGTPQLDIADANAAVKHTRKMLAKTLRHNPRSVCDFIWGGR